MVVKMGSEKDLRKRIRLSQGGKIRQARKLRDLTARQLGDLVGVTEGAVLQWERGRTTPRQHHQALLAKKLDVPWSFLFGLDEVA